MDFETGKKIRTIFNVGNIEQQRKISASSWCIYDAKRCTYLFGQKAL